MPLFEFPLLSSDNRKNFLLDIVSPKYNSPYSSMRWGQKGDESLVIRDGLGDDEIKVVFKWEILSSGDIDTNTNPNTHIVINHKTTDGSFRHSHGTEYKNYLSVEIVDQENKEVYINHLRSIIQPFLANYFQTQFENVYKLL